MTLREIIENPDRWGEFLRTITLVADSNKGIDSNRQHSNQKGWDKLLSDYEEYLRDVENAIRDANRREGHVKSVLVRNIAQFHNKVFSNDEIKTMRRMKYKDFEIDVIRKYFILKNFFSRESEQIKDGKAVVNDKIKNLIARFEVLEKYCLSVSTEGEANVGNNETLSQKRKQRISKQRT